MKKKLTDIQLEVLVCVKEKIEKDGYPPTGIELQKEFGWKSPSAAYQHLDALVKKGWVTRAKGLSRTLRLV